MNHQRFEIGTSSKYGTFEADTIGNDPEQTTFPTLHLAIQEMREVIQQSKKMWGEPMTNGAIYDSEIGQIVWRQEVSRELPVRVLARWNREDWDDDRMVATQYRYYDLESGDEIELTEEEASRYSWGQTEDNITGGTQAGRLSE